MKTNRFSLHLFGRVAAGMLACLLCLAGCSAAPSAQETFTPLAVPKPGVGAPTPIVIKTKKDPATPVTVTMILSKAPRLNEPAELSLVIQSISDAPQTKAELILPEGTQVVSGDITWTGDLQANQPVTLSATIQFTQPGNLTVQGKALSPQANGDVWGDMATLYLNVTEKAGKVGFSN
jgi:hypothetical protein